MNRWMRGFLLVVAFAIIISQSGGTTQAQGEDGRYFEETGHWVSGEFYDAYTSIANPEEIYGNPITEAYQSQITGYFTQYFERARFELRPENSPDLRIHRTLLGEYLYTPGVDLSLPPNFPACKTYPETGKQTCYAFLDYFLKNGGVRQFGFPISNVEVYNDRIVQWFQRARLEYYPDSPDGNEVIIADLGWEYFKSQGEDNRLTDPVKAGNLPRIITRLNAHGFVTQAVMPPTGTQTIFVLVRDQKMEPIAKAQVLLTVTYPSGNELRTILPLTDSDGVTSITFPVSETKQGIAEVNIEVTYESMSRTTRTSFRIWW